ncbi:diguanylate cyclase [Vibrio tapetis subsp. quintayensis]|uniref:sensor domain-containing diguanylate cyclase n=1 Tax=Vibrio tapetis TaxID=52443 RepID=UPI0025B2E157|nr:sensor domain-containing diguanylate cyclase [Vibrio tapetis]MDN3681372.1 diguanylate cyclase [Vibrio tapetis subsp. quintayensis]
MATKQFKKRTLPTIQHMIKRSFLKTAILPLICIEITFLLIYWLTISLSNEQSVKVAKDFAYQDLLLHTKKAALTVSHSLNSVSMLTNIYADQVSRIINDHETPLPPEADNLHFTPSGMYVSHKDVGGAAVYYSGIHPIGQTEKDKVTRTSALDPLMKSIHQSNSLISQIYFNTYDSYNRIYPYFDPESTYKTKMDLPRYNFYYEANQLNNPTRSTVWTDAYLDPAGSGWMISSIAPVYSTQSIDHLEAVVGLDITLSKLINEVLNLNIGWGGYAMVLSPQGRIIAMSTQAEQDLELKELLKHDYRKAILKDNFKPETFDLSQRAETKNLTSQIQASDNGVTEVMLQASKIVSWATLPETNWNLVYWIPAEQIERGYSQIKSELTQIGWLMVAGLFFFYLLFYFYIKYQSNLVARGAIHQLNALSGLIESIGRGHYWQAKPKVHYQELDSLATLTIRMGQRLGDAYNAVAKAEYHAGHDKLTTLPNRYLMEEHLQHSIDLAEREDQQLAVLFFDLNKFKQINDTLGHTVGDVVLKTVATRITSKLRHSDVVARYGGDEFVAVINNVKNTETVEALIESLKHVISIPIEYSEGTCQISSAIGYAIYPQDGQNSQQLIIHADTQMYKQKPTNHG